MHAWHDLEVGPAPPERLHAFIEIPRGSRNKYEIDKPTGVLRLDRLLHSAVHYPGDYGFIPRTFAEDDDPLDILVLITVPTFPGCLIEVRPVGMFEMSDEKGVDHKVLAVPASDPYTSPYRSLEDVPPHTLREIEHFFEIYKELEAKRTDVGGWHGLERTLEAVRESIRSYDELDRAPPG